MARNSVEKVFELVTRVPASSLSTVIDVLANVAEIVSLKQVDGDVPVQVQVVKKAASPANKATKKRGMSGPNTILNILKVGPDYDITFIEKVLSDHGFAATSAHPVISVLVKDGRASRPAPNKVRLLPPAKTE